MSATVELLVNVGAFVDLQDYSKVSFICSCSLATMALWWVQGPLCLSVFNVCSLGFGYISLKGLIIDGSKPFYILVLRSIRGSHMSGI